MPRRYPAQTRRQVIELARADTKVAVSRRVNEVFLGQGIAPKGFSR